MITAEWSSMLQICHYCTEEERGGGLDTSKLEDKGTTCRPPDQGQGWNDSIIQEMVGQAGRWLQREGEVSEK